MICHLSSAIFSAIIQSFLFLITYRTIIPSPSRYRFSFLRHMNEAQINKWAVSRQPDVGKYLIGKIVGFSSFLIPDSFFVSNLGIQPTNRQSSKYMQIAMYRHNPYL